MPAHRQRFTSFPSFLRLHSFFTTSSSSSQWLFLLVDVNLLVFGISSPSTHIIIIESLHSFSSFTFCFLLLFIQTPSIEIRLFLCKYWLWSLINFSSGNKIDDRVKYGVRRKAVISLALVVFFVTFDSANVYDSKGILTSNSGRIYPLASLQIDNPPPPTLSLSILVAISPNIVSEAEGTDDSRKDRGCWKDNYHARTTRNMTTATHEAFQCFSR